MRDQDSEEMQARCDAMAGLAQTLALAQQAVCMIQGRFFAGPVLLRSGLRRAQLALLLHFTTHSRATYVSRTAPRRLLTPQSSLWARAASANLHLQRERTALRRHGRGETVQSSHLLAVHASVYVLAASDLPDVSNWLCCLRRLCLSTRSRS